MMTLKNLVKTLTDILIDKGNISVRINYDHNLFDFSIDDFYDGEDRHLHSIQLCVSEDDIDGYANELATVTAYIERHYKLNGSFFSTVDDSLKTAKAFIKLFPETLNEWESMDGEIYMEWDELLETFVDLYNVNKVYIGDRSKWNNLLNTTELNYQLPRPLQKAIDFFKENVHDNGFCQENIPIWERLFNIVGLELEYNTLGLTNLRHKDYQELKEYSYFAPDVSWGVGISMGTVFAANEDQARSLAQEKLLADCDRVNNICKDSDFSIEWAGGEDEIEIREIK